MDDIESRKRRGEIRERVGLAIINRYGAVWDGELFDDPSAALAYLKKHFPEAKASEFKLAHAIQTIEIYRPLGDAKFVPMPTE